MTCRIVSTSARVPRLRPPRFRSACGTRGRIIRLARTLIPQRRVAIAHACGPCGNHRAGLHAAPARSVLYATLVQPRRGGDQDRRPETGRLHALRSPHRARRLLSVPHGEARKAVSLRGLEDTRRSGDRAQTRARFRRGRRTVSSRRDGAAPSGLRRSRHDEPEARLLLLLGIRSNGAVQGSPRTRHQLPGPRWILGVTTGREDKAPAIPGVPIADLASGCNAALAILAALRVRDRTGRGQFIDVSIYDTAVTLMVLGLARFLATGEEPVAGETLLTGSFPFYSLYETKDGRWLSVATVEPKFWSRMCELIGAPDLASKQFMDGAERFAVAQALAERFRGRTLADWEAVLANESLPITGVKRVSEVVRDPHVKARGLLPVVDVSGLWNLQVIAHPAKHATLETRNPTRVPAKGQDTEEILRSLGYTARQIQTLAKKGVVAI